MPRRERFPAGKCLAAVQRERFPAEKRLPAVQRERFTAEKCLPVEQRERFPAEKCLPVVQRERFPAGKCLPVVQRERFPAGKCLPVVQRERFTAEKCLPVVQRERFAAEKCLPVVQRERFAAGKCLPVVQRERFAAGKWLPEPLFLAGGILGCEKMSTSTRQTPRFVVVLKLPEYDVPLLVIRARSIVERMTDNSWFPSPSPSLAVVQVAIDDLFEAETKTLTGVVGSTTARDHKRTVLVSRLQQLAAHVEAIATANPEHAGSIVESASMYLKKPGGRARNVFTAKPGRVSGEVEVFAPRMGDRASYEFQYSVDGGVTWETLRTGTKARATIKGLKPGSTVLIRHCVIDKGVAGDWSDVIAILVV